VPGVKPPSQIPASRGRCLGLESDGQLFVHLADWALNTSSPEGLKAVRQLPKERKLSLPTTDWARAGAHQRARWHEKETNGETCAFVTDPLLLLLAKNPSTSKTPSSLWIAILLLLPVFLIFKRTSHGRRR